MLIAASMRDIAIDIYKLLEISDAYGVGNP